jgi:inosine-uridine nucleoside N-ribohydrolase
VNGTPTGRRALLLCAAELALLPLARRGARGAAPAKVPVLIDTDVGDEMDDAFALALALVSPELDVCSVTTVAGDAWTRARIACRLLQEVGREAVPVAAGRPAQETPTRKGQFQYGLRPGLRKRPDKEGAVEFLYARLKARPGELTLVALGPLTNVAELFARHPDCKPWVKRLVVMGGSVRVGYNGKPPPEPEWNVKSDVKAAQAVFTAGVPLLVVPVDAAVGLKLDAALRRRVFAARTPLTEQLQALYRLSERPTPTLFDPLAVALCFDERWCKVEGLHLEVDDKGLTRLAPGKANARVATSVRREEFLDWLAGRLAAGGAKEAR